MKKQSLRGEQMKKILVVLCSFFLSIAYATSVEKYYGDKSTEAILTFKAQANIAFKSNVSFEKLLNSPRLKANVIQEIQNQIHYLMGSFQAPSFEKRFGYEAVLGEDFEIKLKGLTKTKSIYRKLIDYTYKGKIVADIRAFKSQDIVSLPIVLPLSYDKIYKLGLDEKDFNLCTDEHYNSEDDFFYFWDPDKKECPLKTNNEDVLRLGGKLKILKNTEETYPEYNLLYKSKEKDGVFNIAVFLGYIDDLEDYTTPKLNDNGYIAFEDLQNYLISKGFEIDVKKDGFKVTPSGQERKGINFYREFSKKVKTQIGNMVTVRVSVLLSDTGINSPDLTFHQQLIPALETSDIFVYDGHSGLGANLALEYFPEINFNQKLYQLFFFNGCSSYPYYNETYFEAKGGSKYLDIMTSGLPTITSTMSDNMQAFLNPFISGRTDSYQKILKNLERSNGEEGTYLTGVNGDEDNKFIP